CSGRLSGRRPRWPSFWPATSSVRRSVRPSRDPRARRLEERCMTSYDDVPRRYDYQAAVRDTASAFLSAVYGWMCAGLAITAATAWFVAGSPSIVHALTSNSVLFWGLLIAQLGIVWVLSARAQDLEASTASILFVLYSIATGATLSFVLLAYSGESVASTFVV